MESLSIYLKEQYKLVKASREALFDYCYTISKEDFIKQNTQFGRGGSIRNLLVHITTTYQFWIANICLKKVIDYNKFEAVKNISETVELFDAVDNFMNEFFENIDSAEEIEYEIDGIKNVTNQFKLFSHVITHEFHHKGQILSISRQLGYIPIDTDIMR